MTKRFLIAAGVALALIPAPAAAQAIAIAPGPVPALADACVVTYQASSSNFICTAAAAASQPLSDAFALIADGTNPTKRLAFEVSGISSGTTRTWTIPDVNLTIPSTIAQLGANTFTALQTMNGGLASTTGTFSSAVSIAATQDLCLDGGGDTCVDEVSANVVRWTVGGSENFRLIGGNGVAVPATFAYYYDGGGDTYCNEASANILRCLVGNVHGYSLSSAGLRLGDSGTAGYAFEVLKSVNNDYIARVANSHGSAPWGVYINYTAAAPNGTSNNFINAADSVGQKFVVRSNGGIANFSANNVNLSDARTKNLTGQVESLRGKFSQIKLYRGRYKDSTRSSDDVMWTAQEIASIDANWSEVFQPEERDAEGNIVRPLLLGTRDNQIFMANVAVTIEHEALIVGLQKQVDTLTRRLDALEAASSAVARMPLWIH